METRYNKRQKRKARIRARITGTSARPRFTVFKSNYAVYGQLIDDERGVTLATVNMKGKTKEKGKALGLEIAKIAKENKITTVVFDRSGYRFHGVVKEIVDGAREGGLTI